ncbi:unnamed protein product [Kluyveromyces dobzhanskii CBS 2104]|uniref:WGS project CCBQ000000000 data, contig 00010 n=1 Tax=Kluyveromyces dobzhanskii CBS 2104 TaxID=1427455 RepID=A0A0A8LA99_9SACH|nr:unnamed protein product [Kluyveromyces dobzhanskii CBS 2104]
MQHKHLDQKEYRETNLLTSSEQTFQSISSVHNGKLLVAYGMGGSEEDSVITKETPKFSPHGRVVFNDMNSTAADEDNSPGYEVENAEIRKPLEGKATSRMLTGINKAIQILGSGGINLSLANQSLLEDTPEGKRDHQINLRSDIRSKTDVLRRFEDKDVDFEVEMPSDFTQSEGIHLNDNDLAATYQADLPDTPLKNKLSIHSLRNAKSDTRAASEPKNLNENITSSPDGQPQTIIMTLKDTDADTVNILRDVNTQNTMRMSNEMLIPATNSTNVSQTQEIKPTLQDDKLTQLIKVRSNDYDVSESLLRLDDHSGLQETSIMHTSPINFGSFHHSLLASERILAPKETPIRFGGEDQLVLSPKISNYRSTQAFESTPSPVVSDEEERDEQEQQEGRDQQIESKPQADTVATQTRSYNELGSELLAKNEVDDNSNEMTFKLTYYAKHSSEMSSAEDKNPSLGRTAEVNENNHSSKAHAQNSTVELYRLDTDQEYEQTQELPEILEHNDYRSKQSFDSQEQLKLSKKRKNRHLVLDEEFEDSSTPSKKRKNSSSQEKDQLPNGLLTSEEHLLTKDEILFNNAVWYYFNDCNYYPGKILSQQHTKLGYCTVLFEKRQNDVKVEDIYYLDIRCGENVHWRMNEYKVVGLDCQNSQDDDVIRCIRGYDTVHLRKLLKNGKLSKNVIVDSIASIYVTTEEWMKRSKIKFDKEDNDPLDDLRRSLRSRSSRKSVSPIKKVAQDYNNSSSEIFRDTFHDTTLMNELEGQRGTVFENCIFVLSGLNDTERKRFSYLVEMQSGHVTNAGFEKLLRYDNGAKELLWSDTQFNTYNLCCLVAGNFSRSPKYLEALALGLPVLHWKFIEQCLDKGQISVATILQNLLPSGESNRFTNNTGQVAIKSSNIYSFLTKFESGLTLKDQLNNSRVVLKKYAILILGNSDMNFFVNFIFQTFQVFHWEYMKNINSKAPAELTSDSISQIMSFQQKYPTKRKLIFINETSMQKSSEWEDLISKTLLEADIQDVTVKTKEWLVQTVINEDVS